MAAGRLDIIAAILAGLQLITVAGGYLTNVVTVEKVLRAWDEIGDSKKPWIGFSPEVERYEYQPSHLIRCFMDLRIVAHVSEKTVDARYTAIENLSDDIIRALRQSVVRGGCADSITLNELQTDQPDPSAYGAGSLSMLYTVTYYRTEPTT